MFIQRGSLIFVRLREDFLSLAVSIPWSNGAFCKWWRSVATSHCKGAVGQPLLASGNPDDEGVDSIESANVETSPITDTSSLHVGGKRQKYLVYRGTAFEPQDIAYIQDLETFYGFKYYLGQYEEMKLKRRRFIEDTIERREAFSKKYPLVWDKKVHWGNFFK